ncbi:rab11 family-interacting protein 4-like [Belonocnema kinseyi]|uniref:rab11 family-interacting protein 4-like n=1 Tax=Belonocnema kinseyi TaxID=2817044 RepID=UPI00143D4443|nr:rab11 family-interacting protein 4-like [Belonocnema kinseyi]
MDGFQMPDIDHLEMSLKEKIYDLEWKTDALEKIQAELNQNRQILYDERMLLNQERRRVRELELQLKSSQEIIELLETEKVKYQQEKIQLQVNCDTASKERDSLLNQARNAKVENILLNSKIQQLEEEIVKKECFGNVVATSLNQLKEEMTKLSQNLQSNFSKLEREQELLRQSVKVTTKFNQRLIVMGMCAHIEHRKQSEALKELRTKFLMKEVEKMDKTDKIESSSDIVPKIQAILAEVNKSESEEDLELNRRLEAIIEDLRNADEE